MKKAYVKPVMESEAFVANEYVAACWITECVESGLAGALCHYNDKVHLYKGGSYNSLDDYLRDNADANFHNGTWESNRCDNEDDNSYYHTPTIGSCHDLKVTDCKNLSQYAKHPNVSN